MSVSVGKSEKSEILLILRNFLRIRKIPAILPPSGPALPILPFLSFFPETVLFFLPFFLSFPKNLFSVRFFEKFPFLLLSGRFSFCEKFSRFFSDLLLFPKIHFFPSVCSFFLNIFFYENVKIQRIKRQTVNFSDCRNPKDLPLSKGFFLFFFLLHFRPLFRYSPAVR